MNTKMNINLIDDLVSEMTPVSPMKIRNGLMLTLAISGLFAVMVVLTTGMRPDLANGVPHPMFFLRGGALLLLGIAGSYAVIAMSKPAVGNSFKGWQWALAAAMLFPLTAIVMAMIAAPDSMAIFVPRYGVECLTISTIVAAGIAAVQVFWLRRGAPVLLARSGWLVGMSSGALGAAAYSLHCPFNSIFYVGLWYTLAVVICAMLGRLIVPHLIRW